MRKICKNCMYVNKEEGFMGNWYCSLITERGLFGTAYYKTVSSTSSCDRFSEAITAENSGYSKGEGCFLTSACVEYMGKADDCEELTILRAFRDTYLKSSEEGKKIVEEYYQIAPCLVKKIQQSDKKDIFYDYIYENIKKCITAINTNESETAVEIYKNMVNWLIQNLN